MIPQNIFNILKKNSQVFEFLNGNVRFEVLFKKLDYDELERLFNEYPYLLQQESNTLKTNLSQRKKEIKTQSILSITLVRRDMESSNYTKLRKIKLYFDELNGKILKILQN